MDIELKCLILDKTVEAAEELQQALEPEITFSEFEVRRTLHKGIQAFRETPFELCIVSDAFQPDELKAFFSDVKVLQGDNNCVFVQVRDALEEGVERRSLASSGFVTIISRKATDGDKAAIADATKEFVAKKEIKRRKVDVETAVKLLMLEIDRVAKERKRGREQQYSRNIVSDFLTEQLEFHSDVLDGYFKALEIYSDKGEPVDDLVVQLPQELLALCPPGIVDGMYAGASLRVWEMLQGKFGMKRPGEETTVTELEPREQRLASSEDDPVSGEDSAEPELESVSDKL